MKKRRHAKIIELIKNNNVETQEELQNLLRENGFEVTQATISRDIKELRLVKELSECLQKMGKRIKVSYF